MFKRENRNWMEYKSLPSLVEIDGYHPDDRSQELMPFHERMDAAYKGAIECLRTAQKEGSKFVLFRHGLSTSRIGAVTFRSQIRKAMRSKDATPFIIRSESIQHPSVFVAAIRPKG